MSALAEWWLVALAVAGLVSAVLLAISLARVGRRSQFASTREIVRAAEELAEGRFDRPASLAPDDPLGPAASALARLAGAGRGQTLELERRVKLFEELLGSARETALLITDAGGDIRYASPGSEALLGWRPGEGQGQRVEVLFEDPADFETLLPKLSRRSIREAPVRQEARLRRREGGPIRTELRASGLADGFVFEIRDLTNEEALRAELAASEERHRTLAERVPVGVFVLQRGKILFANRALEDLLQKWEGLVGSDVRSYLASEDLLRVVESLRRVESGDGPALETECRILPACGRWPLEATLSAARIHYGGLPAVIGCAREAGADRGLLRLARVSETKLDAALGASEEGVLLLSDSAGAGTVTLANRRFEEMLGLGPHGLAGLDREELVERVAERFADRGAVRACLLNLVASRGAEGRERRDAGADAFETDEAPPRTIAFSSRPAHDREGRRIGLLLSARDLTLHRENERKLAREAEELARTRDLLEKANRDLADVNRQLSQRSAEVGKANEELRTLDEMKSNLLANVSHELQTPLVSIKGYTDMILKGRLGAVTDEQRKGLEVSLRNIDRLVGMINNLLNFSRLEREMAGLAITTFPLPELVEEAVELVRETAAQRRISLTSRYQTDDLEVRGDRERIGQVFTNLLTNAVKYNREGGQVQIDVRKGRRGYLLVDVRDTGIGIPRESVDKIFDRFYRAPGEAPASASGTGIGLSIVRDVLRMHGCIIKVESGQGEGTVFTFTLPLASRTEESEISSSRTRPSAQPG